MGFFDEDVDNRCLQRETLDLQAKAGRHRGDRAGITAAAATDIPVEGAHGRMIPGSQVSRSIVHQEYPSNVGTREQRLLRVCQGRVDCERRSAM